MACVLECAEDGDLDSGQLRFSDTASMDAALAAMQPALDALRAGIHMRPPGEAYMPAHDAIAHSAPPEAQAPAHVSVMQLDCKLEVVNHGIDGSKVVHLQHAADHVDLTLTDSDGEHAMQPQQRPTQQACIAQVASLAADHLSSVIPVKLEQHTGAGHGMIDTAVTDTVGVAVQAVVDLVGEGADDITLQAARYADVSLFRSHFTAANVYCQIAYVAVSRLARLIHCKPMHANTRGHSGADTVVNVMQCICGAHW